jgi:dipeptidase E
MKKGHIIAMGGGGFSMEPDNLLLDQYVIDCTGKQNPRVCFIPTASADSMQYTLNFYTAFNKLGCLAGHLSLFNQPQRDLEAYLRGFDIIYVGGGNTRNLVALWREWNLDSILRRLWQGGVVLAGISAGAICWFEQGTTDSIPGDLTVMNCLGFLKGSCCPHYNSEEQRRPTYHRFVADGAISAGYALDDGAAAHFEGDTLVEIVASRPDARAYYVEKAGEAVTERLLTVCYLGTS